MGHGRRHESTRPEDDHPTSLRDLNLLKRARQSSADSYSSGGRPHEKRQRESSLASSMSEISIKSRSSDSPGYKKGEMYYIDTNKDTARTMSVNDKGVKLAKYIGENKDGLSVFKFEGKKSKPVAERRIIRKKGDQGGTPAESSIASPASSGYNERYSPKSEGDNYQRGAQPLEGVDEDKMYLVRVGDDDMALKYKGPSNKEGFQLFENSQKETLRVDEDYINGIRPIVAGTHPSDRIRLPKTVSSDTNFTSLSGANLSYEKAYQSQNPEARMASTTYESTERNVQLYYDAAANKETLRRLNIKVFDKFDVSDKARVREVLSNMAQDGEIHFHMPRVPQGTRDYSTQRLINDTLSIPKSMGRTDLTVSITVPEPSTYRDFDGKSSASHNRIYGIESGNALAGTGMRLVGYKPDVTISGFGYEHRQSTTDASTGVADTRRTYYFEAVTSESASEKDEPVQKPRKSKTRSRRSRDTREEVRKPSSRSKKDVPSESELEPEQVARPQRPNYPTSNVAMARNDMSLPNDSPRRNVRESGGLTAALERQRAFYSTRSSGRPAPRYEVDGFEEYDPENY